VVGLADLRGLAALRRRPPELHLCSSTRLTYFLVRPYGREPRVLEAGFDRDIVAPADDLHAGDGRS
jgi:hypothetical protein